MQGKRKPIGLLRKRVSNRGFRFVGVVLSEEQIKCKNCGSFHTVRHGFNTTKSGKFARRKCQECGTTFYEDRNKEGKQQ